MKTFTPLAAKTILLANKIAAEFNIDFISLDILFIALIRTNHGISGLILNQAGITEEMILTELNYDFIRNGAQPQSRKTETAPSAPVPSASAKCPPAGATTPSATNGPAFVAPSPAAPAQTDHRDTLPETTVPQSRRHIPLEETIDKLSREKWLLEYHHSLLTAKPQDLSPLDIAFLQRTSGNTAGRNLWQSWASAPAMPVLPAAAEPVAPAPENPTPAANLWMVPCPNCGEIHLRDQAPLSDHDADGMQYPL